MPYIRRDESLKVTTVYGAEQIDNVDIDILSASCSNKVVSIEIDTELTRDAATFTKAVISGCSEDLYNGKFPITKISNTEFTYELPIDPENQPSGDIKINFAIEYVDTNHADYLAFNTRLQNIALIASKNRLLCGTDYKVIRHNEEIACGIVEANRTLTQAEFDTLHTERQQLRDDITILEDNL